MPFGFFRRRNRRRAIDRINFSTLVGKSTVYRGDIAGDENYHIYGSVYGDSDIDGHLVLAAGARWRGNIRARHVVIAGEVDGNVSAVEKLELHETARIVGNITAPVIAIAEGAVYDGKIHMRPRPHVTRFSEKRSTD